MPHYARRVSQLVRSIRGSFPRTRKSSPCRFTRQPSLLRLMLPLSTGEPTGKRTRRHAPVRGPWGTMSAKTGPQRHAMPCYAGQRHRSALSVYLPSIRRGCSPLCLGADFYRGFAWPLAKRFALSPAPAPLRLLCACSLSVFISSRPALRSLAAAFSSAIARLRPAALIRAEGASSAPKDSLFTPQLIAFRVISVLPLFTPRFFNPRRVWD